MDATSILNGTTSVVQGLVTFVTGALAMLIGVVCIYQGLKKIVNHAHGHRQGQATIGPVAIHLGVGAIFVQFTFMTSQLVTTIFGSGPQNPNTAMQYMPSQVSSDAVLTALVNAAVLWLYAIGFCAIVRGLIKWNSLADGRAEPSAGWKGLWHILFGAMAINIPGVLQWFS